MGERTTRRPAARDLGDGLVEHAYHVMQIDDEWAVREPRGFTWWGSWCRQRVWSGAAVRTPGYTLWHVRARTPGYCDVPDEPATYAFVADLNRIGSMSAYVYDPLDRTISARCGGFVHEQIAAWLGPLLIQAVAYQSSIAWGQLPAQARGRRLDDEPHPVHGVRAVPDDMLNVAGYHDATRPPISAARLRRLATAMAKDGQPARYRAADKALEVLIELDGAPRASWSLAAVDHPVHGPGIRTRLVLPVPNGTLRAQWLANALNLAEAADWSGEDRAHALGAWIAQDGVLSHTAYLPAAAVGNPDDEQALVITTNLQAWGTMRTRFAGERLGWLLAAAAARYPDDAPDQAPGEPAEDALASLHAAISVPLGGNAAADDAADDADADGDADGDQDDDEDGDEAPDDDPEARLPVRERSFGPGSRRPRPAGLPDLGRLPVEHLVDPAHPDAFHEIDDAVVTAGDGDTVRVRPGTYRRPVVLDRAVAIVADGPPGSVVLEPVGGECIGVAASGGSVRGLVVRPSRAGNDGALHSAIAVHDAEVTVEACELTTHLGATVWVGGPSSLAVLRDCRLVDGAQNSVWVTEEGRAELHRCHISGHRWPAMAGGEHASLRVVDSEIADNLDSGLVGAGGARLVVERTVVRGNADDGISLLGAAPSSRIAACTVEANAGYGILVRGSLGVRVEANRIRRNGGGIIVDGGATPVLEANEMADNATVGIGIAGDETAPVVTGNEVDCGRPVGIVVRAGAGGTFERNHLRGGEASGIWLADPDTRPVFRANVVSGAAGHGVRVSDGAGGIFEANDLRGNADGSWDLDEPGDLRRSGNLEDLGSDPGWDAPAGSAQRLN